MMIREPVVAGRFYPSDPKTCRADVARLLRDARADTDAHADPTAAAPTHEPNTQPTRFGGLVPHAGWTCSGAVAAAVFRALADARAHAEPPAVIVLFGGVHHYRGRDAAVFPAGRWNTPLGPATIDDRLVERILGHTNLVVEDPYAHEHEHSLEVQMPFVRHLFPDARIVPIMVPTTSHAARVGERVAATLTAYAYNALIVGTTDLTHYGPGYGFVDHGVGPDANRWAKQQNDTRFIDLVCAMKPDDLVPEATKHGNACSSGAAAATVAAVNALGATRGILLQHTTSAEVLQTDRHHEPNDAVGYAAVVFA